jgi:hypothetical protein
MEVKVEHIEKLLHALSARTRQPLDFHGFDKMSELVEGKTNANVSKRYLYETLFRKISQGKNRKGEKIKVQPYKLDKISEYLGHENFQSFIHAVDNPIHPVLKGSIGTYHSYLRRNSADGVIFCSPVKIIEADQKIQFQLKGPLQVYMGDVEFRNGCLFILMQTDNGKQFHHVYQVGQREKPDVLQGVFSGVSTAFEPIGGRVILIRTTEKFESLKNQQVEISQLKKSKNLQDRRIAEYFHDYLKNNISIRKAGTFGIADLGECK